MVCVFAYFRIVTKEIKSIILRSFDTHLSGFLLFSLQCTACFGVTVYRTLSLGYVEAHITIVLLTAPVSALGVETPLVWLV